MLRKNVRSIEHSRYSYDSLEQRQLLAVTSFFDQGVLEVELTGSMEVASVGTVNDVVQVNGEMVDADQTLPGIQPLTVEQVEVLNFSGSAGVFNARVELIGSFDTGDLEEINLENINQFANSSDLFVSEFQADFIGTGGQFVSSGAIQVDGLFAIDSLATNDSGF